jgi:hypothetical protein
MFYLPCADHVLLFVDDVVTSWPETKILLLCIMQLLEVAWYTLWDRTCSILYSKDHDSFYLWPIRDLGFRSGGYNIINK